jgi:hypothetical protein
MKNIIAVLALSLAFVSCDNATARIQNEGAAGGAEDANLVTAQGTPAFQFDTEFHDFGEIEEGIVAEHIFKFTNSGDAPLIISNAQGSCGCTVPDYPRTPIAPGETGEIKVSFNSAGRGGKQDKQVTLNANTVPNTHVLKITSQVKPSSKPAES